MFAWGVRPYLIDPLLIGFLTLLTSTLDYLFGVKHQHLVRVIFSPSKSINTVKPVVNDEEAP